jgi:hypothetical protein
MDGPSPSAKRALAAALASLLLGACSAQRVPPVMPPLPEVRYVPPCDPDATIALTADGEAALVERDRVLRAHLAQLEALLRGDD